jgi:hypothetical protein
VEIAVRHRLQGWVFAGAFEVAQRAFERMGRHRRGLRVVDRHRPLGSPGAYTMCREDGQWKLAQ